MTRALFNATKLPNATSPYDVLHLKIYYPASPTNSDAERMSGVIPADTTSAPMPVVIFFNGINVGIEGYHWLAVKLAEANIVTVMYTHVAETLPGVIGLTPAIDLARVKPDTYGSGPTCPAIQPILDSLAKLNGDDKCPLHNVLNLNNIILGGH
jgi:predicted dienelactone hydrolase